MPDHLIVNGDHQLRIQALHNLGLPAYEIARMLNLPEQRVSLLIKAVDSREQFTTTNC